MFSFYIILNCYNIIRAPQSHCCLAPSKSVPNYGPLTEPKIFIVKFDCTAIPTSNDHISETKRDFLDPLVPKFSYDRGLSPTLSWKWPSATLSPSFGLFQSEKPLFRGVPGVPRCTSLVRICPRDLLPSRKKKFARPPILSEAVQILWSLSLSFFSLIFTQPAWKHYIYCPPSPPSNQTTPHTPPHHWMIMWYQINDILSFILCDFVTLNTIFLFSMLLLKGFSSWPNSSVLVVQILQKMTTAINWPYLLPQTKLGKISFT